MTILVDLLLTVFVYLFFPFLYLKIKGRVPLKKAKKMSLINAIVCAVLFVAFRIVLYATLGGELTASGVAPALLYYYIGVSMLKEKGSGNHSKNYSNKSSSGTPPRSLHHIDDDDYQ